MRGDESTSLFGCKRESTGSHAERPLEKESIDYLLVSLVVVVEGIRSV
jgi:hypothetical protein